MHADTVIPAIIVRRPKFELTGELPVLWAENAFATHTYDALSSVFPDGEAFFVRSVLHYADQVDDPQLQRDIRAFVAQESRHRAEHDRHLALLVERYPALAKRNQLLDKVLRYSQPKWPRLSIGSTAALEHLTALLARRLLSSPELFTGRMDERMAPLWLWHALEEAEHKSVAFDVMQAATPSYPIRVYTLATNTIGLLLETLDRTLYMLWKDGLLFRRSTWADGWRFLFGREGLLRRTGRDYWAWYRRDFHPAETDDTALIQRFRARFDDEA